MHEIIENPLFFQLVFSPPLHGWVIGLVKKQTLLSINCVISVHGAWGSWTDSSDCSRSCDGGIRYRIRMCNNPSPSFGGNWCPGSVTEYQTCNTEACPGKIDLISYSVTLGLFRDSDLSCIITLLHFRIKRLHI